MMTFEAPLAEHLHDEGITPLLHRIRSGTPALWLARGLERAHGCMATNDPRTI